MGFWVFVKMAKFTQKLSALSHLLRLPGIGSADLAEFRASGGSLAQKERIIAESVILMKVVSAMNIPFRVGQGCDVHALTPGRKLILGGVLIPHPQGLLGHSDADALLHAITDAILGAAGLGDIGRMFPDSDPQWEGADSRHLLRGARAAVQAAGWQVGNVDATIIAQAPRIATHVAAMRANIAADLEIAVAAVNVKGKTTERLGFTGRSEGIATEAIALLVRQE